MKRRHRDKGLRRLPTLLLGELTAHRQVESGEALRGGAERKSSVSLLPLISGSQSECK